MRFILAAMKIDPCLSDEPSITPPTPGACVVRLSEILGVLRRNEPDANGVPSLEAKLASAREALLEAIESGQNLGTPFDAAQKCVQEVYTYATEKFSDTDAQADALMQLGFPDPRLKDADKLLPVDVLTVITTHFKPVRQVFSTITFREAHGATAYWLHEVRELDGEDLVDAVVENYAPYFSRVRLPVGKHRLIIESRNTSYSVLSEVFEIEVPAL